MLRDWVPARSSADTGIVVKSHMLERNKYPRKEPTWSTSSYDADYELLTLSGSDGGAVIGNTNFIQVVPIQYNGTASAAFTASSGYVQVSQSYGWPQYTGEFDGATIVASINYFPQEEVSSYTYPWTSSVPGNGPLFLTYSLSPLYQNVYTPVRSQRFFDLDYNSSQIAPTNYGLITRSMAETLLIGNVSQSEQLYSQYAFIQDFNYYSRAYTVPRYSGSYLLGQAYNQYTTGDTSYGSEPVINWYSQRLGLFTQVATSSFFPGKVNVLLAYFADVSGGLFELNQNNRNWVDVQNTFKAGTTLTVKQFDNKKYSNQVGTDGIKTIYNSGYNYTPQLYFTSGLDNTIFFNPTSTPGVTFYAINSGSNLYISGTASPDFPVSLTTPSTRQGYIYNIFNSANPSTGYNTGSTALAKFPSYTASLAEIKTFSVRFDVNWEFPDPEFNPAASGSFNFDAILNGTTALGPTQTFTITSSYVPSTRTTGSINTSGTVSVLSPNYTVLTTAGVHNGPFNISSSGTPVASNIGNASSYISMSVVQLSGGAIYVLASSISGDLSGYVTPFPSANTTTYVTTPTGGTTSPSSKTFKGTGSIDYSYGPSNLAPGDIVTFPFRQNTVSTSNYTASLSAGYLKGETVSVGAGGYVYATTTSSFIEAITNTTPFQAEITLNRSLSSYLGYQFVPYFVSGGVTYSSSLYSKYGDVNVTFDPQAGDKILLFDSSGINQDLDVISSSVVSNKVVITVAPNILTNWAQDPDLILRFLLLRRYNDEQNLILTFNKAPGATSYGFVLPETISPQVTDNINTLQASVQSQLLTQQSISPESSLP